MTQYRAGRLKARYVLAHQDGRHRWLEDGVVTYRDGVITDVSADGSADMPHGVARDGSDDPVVDLGNVVLLPGFIDLDALVDIDHLILDSWHDPRKGLDLVGSAGYWSGSPRDVLTMEQRHTLREFGLAQLAMHGVTTYMPIASEVHLAGNEDPDELRHLARLTREMGLRGYLGPSYRSAVVAAGPDGRQLVDRDGLGEEGLAAALSFADEVIEDGDPHVLPALLPCRIETLTEDLLRRTASEAESRGVLVRLHSLQSPWERTVIEERSGVTPLELIARSGLLNDRLLIPHGSWTDHHPRLGGGDLARSRDLPRMAEAGVTVVHCPLTSFRYGAMLRTFADYRRAGVRIALGSDSFPPDLIRALDVGFHAPRIVWGHQETGLADYFDALSLGGAEALRRPDLGRLQQGASADLVAFSLDDFRDGVVEDPLRTLVYNSTGRSVVHSVVAGRTVVRDGTLPGIDLADLRARAQEAFAALRAGYQLRDLRDRAPEQLFPPTYEPMKGTP